MKWSLFICLPLGSAFNSILDLSILDRSKKMYLGEKNI